MNHEQVKVMAYSGVFQISDNVLKARYFNAQLTSFYVLMLCFSFYALLKTDIIYLFTECILNADVRDYEELLSWGVVELQSLLHY